MSAPSGDQLHQLYQIAQSQAAAAVRYDKNGRQAEARDAYVEAASALDCARKLERHSAKQLHAMNMAMTYVNRAEQLDAQLRPPPYSGGQADAAAATGVAAPSAPPAPGTKGGGGSAAASRPQVATRADVPEEAVAPHRAHRAVPAEEPPQPAGGRVGGKRRNTAGPGPGSLQDFFAIRDPGRGGEDVVIETLTLRHGGRVYTNAQSITASTKNVQHHLRNLAASLRQAHADHASGPGDNRPNNNTGNGGSPRRAAGPSTQALVDGVGIAEDGSLVEARPDFHQDQVVQRPDKPDSGVYYRDKDWQELIGQKQNPVGPHQAPRHERLSLADRNKVIKKSREGTRVNPSSQERAYAIDGYETSVFIDESRTIDVPLPKNKPPRKMAPGAATESAILFETAAVGAKLRNTHKVGGERVKEMDHFVASVETPNVTVKLPDIAEFVLETAMEGLEPVGLDVPAKRHLTQDVHFELYIQTRFRTPDNRVSDTIWEQACGFYRLLRLILHEVFLLPMDAETVRVYFMTTIRADQAVASRSAVDGRLYFNLLCFQQQQAYDGQALTQPKRTVLYWTQRIAMVLAADTEGPTGLYDPVVRTRFAAILAQLVQDPSI